MKKQEDVIAQMDEIIFEHRNKAYGAYLLRKMYNKHLTRALLISIAILMAGLAYPLVSGYYLRTIVRHFEGDGTTVIMPEPDSRDDVVTPPALPPISDIDNRIRFVAPEVTVDAVSEEDGLPSQDDLNQLTANVPVDVPVEAVIEKKGEVMDIPEAQKEIFTIVEEMPSYPGGDALRQKFLAENMVYPQQDAETGIQGTVYVQFVVDSKGNITDVKILRGIGGTCDAEASRVVKMMPQWHPGKQNGKAVRVLFIMPVVFKLQS